jgi:hypothetical protein
MRKLLAATLLAFTLGSYGVAFANCVTTTYFIDGKMIICTQCCYGNSCSVNCI